MPIIGTPTFLEITGVTQQKSSTDAEAEFTWQFNPSEFAEVAKLGPRGIQKGTAKAKRYDDGWRLVEM